MSRAAGIAMGMGTVGDVVDDVESYGARCVQPTPRCKDVHNFTYRSLFAGPSYNDDRVSSILV